MRRSRLLLPRQKSRCARSEFRNRYLYRHHCDCTATGLSIVIRTWNVGLEVVSYYKSVPDGNAVSAGQFILYPMLCLGIFCIYYNSRVELLRGTVPGIPYKRQNEDRDGIPVPVYSGCVYRTVYDGGSSMEDRRYL